MRIQSSSLPLRFTRALLTLATCALALPAAAHEVWIEDAPDGQVFVRFAAYGDDYEKSPGALDALTTPFAWVPAVESKEEAGKVEEGRGAEIRAGKVAAFEVQKKADGYLLNGASVAKVALAETGFTVMGKAGDPEKPARKPFFYARWQPEGAGAAQPALNFDLVPTGTPGKVGVYFRGKPLAGAKVTLYPPAEAEQELVSDAEGLVHFTATKPGLYLLAAAHHREAISGFFGGKAYDAISHNCSLAWRQSGK